MNRRSYLKRLALLGGSIALPVAGVTLVGRHQFTSDHELPRFTGRIMGTGYSVILGDKLADGQGSSELSQDAELSKLALESHNILSSVDESMSTWRVESELSQFNQVSHKDWTSISPATFNVITSAMHVSKRTGGAFDITVGPMVDLWGFGAGAREVQNAFGNIPSAQQVNHALKPVGYGWLDVDSGNLAIRKQNIGTQIDLSGIAKGYAVDQLDRYLKLAGYKSYLIEVGGELRSAGNKPNGEAWKVAIETPGRESMDAYRVFDLQNMSVATSGDYRHFFHHGNQRYSHSIDPRTGYPTTHSLASATVVAQSAMQADALSTALMIMGPDEAMTFCEANAVAAHFIVRSQSGQLSEIISRRFLTTCADCV